MKSDKMRFLRTLNVAPSVEWGRGPSLPSVASLPARSLRSLPLPKLGLNNSCWNAGVRWCGNRRASHFLHLTYGLIYSIAGGVQFTAGIYFMMALPIFQLGSNIWTGAWNMFSGIVTIMLCCFGQLSMKKAQGLLLMSLVVTVVNLINLLVLEVGEWRGFLSQMDEDYINQYGLNYLMKSAYICTTLSTIVAMVASFLGSQHTFCFLQLRAEEESARKISGGGDGGRDNQGDYTKEMIRRHDDDGLNLKTPGPKPHPSWVYRYNLTTEERIGVQRSMSLLQHTAAARNKTGTSGAGAASASFQRLDLLGPLPGLPRDLSPPAAGHQISTISDKVDGMTGNMRHAIIRRHNSMYTASSRTMGPNPFQPPYKLHDVSGASEVRPIVTLQRSKTSITPSSGPYYRTAALHSVARSYSTAPQFRQYVARYRQADVPLHGTATRYKKNKSRQQPEKVDQFCEFQAGSSFDLPNLATLQRARNQNTSPLYDDEHNYSAVMFDTEDGKTTSKSSRLVRDTETSSNENIRYQAMDMIKKDTRVHRKESTASRSNSMNTTRRYYSSWDDLLERSEVRDSKTNLLSSQQYGSTGSVNSYNSETERGDDGNKNSRLAAAQQAQALYQAAGHHLQLHAVHNTSYQTNSTLETCLESDENDLDDLGEAQLYDIPRKTHATVKKSNSRVSSNGKLSLRVESFKQSKNSSGTQTDLSSVSKVSKSSKSQAPGGYIGQYKKATTKQAPSKPVRKHKRKSSHGDGDARSPSPANSSTSGYSSPSLGLQSKESSPPLSKTPSPGQSLDIIDQQKDPRRSRMRNGLSPSKHASDDTGGERITVISITPHHVSSNNHHGPGNNSLKKSNLKQSSKYGDGTYSQDYAAYNNRSSRPREPSDESNLEEYQIEDIEREIQRKSPEDDPEDHYRGHIISNENRRNSADDGNSNTLRKAGSKIATNGSLNMSKKHQSPVRQASVLHAQSWQEEPALNEEVVDDIDSEDNEHYATLNEQHHYSTLRKGHPAGSGSSRYQRNSRSAQMSHFSQFSRLPPVPERPSLENRELSPVPDIVSPTSPILAQSFHSQSSYNDQRTASRRENRQESPSHRNTESSSLTRKAVGDVADVHSTATLGRRKSRIPTAAKHHQNRMNRTVSDGDLGTESVDERLETLLHLLGGSRHGTIGNSGSNIIPPDLVSGTPGDTLQYLSQLEMVARKLKHQLIKQKQDDRQSSIDHKAYKGQEESEC